jgi:hypothetical protein
MKTSSRREFVTYAAAATLASGYQTDQTKKDKTLLPLVVDVIGPMAFRWSGSEFELWMPFIEKYPHQAGIMTSVTSFELPPNKNDYRISGPSSFNGKPELHRTGGGQIFQAKVKETSAPSRLIKMLFPMPRLIVLLDPVWAKINPRDSAAPSTNELYAVGVRLRYDHAGEPTLYDSKGVSHLVPNGKIPFDPAPGETQLNMLIGYEAYDTTDPSHAESKESFHQISMLFPPLDLQVEFDSQPGGDSFKVIPFSGIFRDCRSPVLCPC